MATKLKKKLKKVLKKKFFLRLPFLTPLCHCFSYFLGFFFYLVFDRGSCLPDPNKCDVRRLVLRAQRGGQRDLVNVDLALNKRRGEIS